MPIGSWMTKPSSRRFMRHLATTSQEPLSRSALYTPLEEGNRDLKNRFGTKAYAAEELVAELTAAFLCAHLGIQGELRHAGYIADWIRLLKEDDRAVFTAASKASQAAEFLRAFSEDTSAEENELAA
jgi:antirestriction protein ArdC